MDQSRGYDFLIFFFFTFKELEGHGQGEWMDWAGDLWHLLLFDNFPSFLGFFGCFSYGLLFEAYSYSSGFVIC